jgi:FkbM family methyltransferase
MLDFSKKIFYKILDLAGIEIRRKRQVRASMHGCLQQAVRNGLKPNTVIDVGVAYGTQALYELFPNARHILIEPLEEFVPHLDNLVAKLNNKAEYIIAAATSTPGNIVINVHPDLVGSSAYKEEEDSNVNFERIVPAVTLDNVCRDRKTSGPYVIKIDTQGSELDVLRGAETVLRDTELVILEVSFFEFFKGGPQIYDYITFMKERGFVAYDVFDLQYRLLDGAMSQCDIAFAKNDSCFREFHFYATREQRCAQNKRLNKR